MPGTVDSSVDVAKTHESSDVNVCMRVTAEGGAGLLALSRRATGFMWMYVFHWLTPFFSVSVCGQGNSLSRSVPESFFQVGF